MQSAYNFWKFEYNYDYVTEIHFVSIFMTFKWPWAETWLQTFLDLQTLYKQLLKSNPIDLDSPTQP